MNDFGKEDFGRLENVFIGFWFETQKAKTTIHKASFKPCYTGGGAPWRCRTGLGGHLGRTNWQNYPKYWIRQCCPRLS